MKNIVVLLLLIGYSCYAQDTLIWKNKSRTVVTITDMYEDTLFYIHLSDKKPDQCHLSKLNSILYKDGSKRDFEGLYMDSVPEVVNLDVPATVPPDRDTALYNKGIRDANEHFKHKDFWMLKKRRSPNDPTAIGILPIWTIPLLRQFAPFTELDLVFPDKELEIKSEYRLGYVYQCRKLRKKHQRKTLVLIAVAATIVVATIVF